LSQGESQNKVTEQEGQGRIRDKATNIQTQLRRKKMQISKKHSLGLTGSCHQQEFLKIGGHLKTESRRSRCSPSLHILDHKLIKYFLPS